MGPKSQVAHHCLHHPLVAHLLPIPEGKQSAAKAKAQVDPKSLGDSHRHRQEAVRHRGALRRSSQGETRWEAKAKVPEVPRILEETHHRLEDLLPEGHPHRLVESP